MARFVHFGHFLIFHVLWRTVNCQPQSSSEIMAQENRAQVVPKNSDRPQGQANKISEVKSARNAFDIERLKIKYEEASDSDATAAASSAEDSNIAAQILDTSRRLWVNNSAYKKMTDDEKYDQFLSLLKLRLRRDLKTVLGPDLYLSCMSRQMILSYSGAGSNKLVNTMSAKDEGVFEHQKVTMAFNRVNDMHALEDWMSVAGDKSLKFVDYFRYADQCNLLTRSSYVHHMWWSGFKYLAKNNTEGVEISVDEMQDPVIWQSLDGGKEVDKEPMWLTEKKRIYEEHLRNDEVFLQCKFSRADWFKGQNIATWDHTRTVRNHNVFNAMDRDEDGFINAVEWCVNEWRYLVNYQSYRLLSDEKHWENAVGPSQDETLRNNGYYALVSKENFLDANAQTFTNPIVRRVMLHSIGYPRGLRLKIMDPHGRMRASAFAGVMMPVWWKLGITAVDEYTDNLNRDPYQHLLNPLDWTKEVREGSIDGRIPELPF